MKTQNDTAKRFMIQIPANKEFQTSLKIHCVKIGVTVGDYILKLIANDLKRGNS